MISMFALLLIRVDVFLMCFIITRFDEALLWFIAPIRTRFDAGMSTFVRVSIA